MLTEPIRLDRHCRGPAEPAEYRRAPNCSWRRSTGSNPAKSRPGRSQLTASAWHRRLQRRPLKLTGRSLPSQSALPSGPARPRPGAWTQLTWRPGEARPCCRGHRRPAAACGHPAAGSLGPGELQVLPAVCVVGTATVPVELGEVQQDGKRRMQAADWARGLHLDDGPAVLG